MTTPIPQRTLREIQIEPIRFEDSRVHIAWRVKPETALYKQNHFTLDFGDALDPRELLCEFTRRPLLVNTVSPGYFKDHTSRAREQVTRAIVQRRNCELIEVKSDFRSSWRVLHSRELGYAQTVNELCDVFLYTSNFLALAASRGMRNIFQASDVLQVVIDTSKQATAKGLKPDDVMDNSLVKELDDSSFINALYK